MSINLRDVPFPFRRALRPRAGSRVERLDRSMDEYVCLASNARIEIGSGVRIGVLRIEPGLQRVHVKGGRFGSIEFVPPRRAAAVSTDLVFEGCFFGTSVDHHMRIYARRIEFIGCGSEGTYYACFASDDVPDTGAPTRFRLEDFLFYRCKFKVNGRDSACVRLHDINRLVIKDSVVATGGRHGLRVHGKSNNLFIRNLRCEDSDGPGNGIHLGSIGGGTIAADRANIGRLWLRDVTSRVTSDEDIGIERDGSVRNLIADNVWSYRPAGSFSSWGEITSAPLPRWTITNSGRLDAD